jgi:hypothetical protein
MEELQSQQAFSDESQMMVLDSAKKRQAQPGLTDQVSNKKKLINTVQMMSGGQQAKTLTAQRMMMETGAAIAAHGAAMLQTMGKKKWSKKDIVEEPQYGIPRTSSPSRSRSRHLDSDFFRDDSSKAL